MKRYYNNSTDEWYYEGKRVTRKTNKGLFSGIPTEEHLKEWGFEEYAAPVTEPVELTEEEIEAQRVAEEEAKADAERLNRMSDIQKELASMDYLTSKYIDGEDMSGYGDWQAKRRALREEYRGLENINVDE